ncbi:MAG: hypothetical protein ACK5Z2_17195 [Bacteroidota bacterium]|jgi:hypothetical protein
MLTKEKVIDIVSEMPESFSAEQLIERIILLNKVEEGLKQAEEGKVYSIEESKKMNKRWLK